MSLANDYTENFFIDESSISGVCFVHFTMKDTVLQTNNFWDPESEDLCRDNQFSGIKSHYSFDLTSFRG